MLPFMRAENGSFRGKRREPDSTECSMMWETPVSSRGGVVKQNAKRFSTSEVLRWRTSHPVAVWRRCVASARYSGSGRSERTSKAAILLAGIHGAKNIRFGSRRVYVILRRP